MALSFSSVLSTSIMCSIAIVLCYLILPTIQAFLFRKISGFIIVLTYAVFILIRLVLPVEFSFSHSVAFVRGLPELRRVLATPISEIGDFNVTVLFVICSIWILVSLGILVRTVTNYRVFRRDIETSIVGYVDIIECPHHNSNKKLAFVISSAVDTPLIVGYVKPLVVFPMIHFTAEEIAVITKHELAHYKSGDLWVKLAVKFVMIVYWWNPCVYLFGRIVSGVLETKIDRLLISRMTKEEQITYLECLLKVAKTRVEARKNDMSLSFGNVKVYASIMRMVSIDNELDQRTRIPLLQVLILTLIMIMPMLFSFFTTFEPYSIPNRDAASTFSITTKNAYLVHAANGTYDLFIDNEYEATLSEIPGFFPDLHIIEGGNLKCGEN